MKKLVLAYDFNFILAENRSQKLGTYRALAQPDVQGAW